MKEGIIFKNEKLTPSEIDTLGISLFIANFITNAIYEEYKILGEIDPERIKYLYGKLKERTKNLSDIELSGLALTYFAFEMTYAIYTVDVAKIKSKLRDFVISINKEKFSEEILLSYEAIVVVVAIKFVLLKLLGLIKLIFPDDVNLDFKYVSIKDYEGKIVDMDLVEDFLAENEEDRITRVEILLILLLLLAQSSIMVDLGNTNDFENLFIDAVKNLIPKLKKEG